MTRERLQLIGLIVILAAEVAAVVILVIRFRLGLA